MSTLPPAERSRLGVDSLASLEVFHSLVRSAVLVGLMFAAGVIGFLILGGEEHGLIDAVYMTVITLTTVGYGETIEITGHPAGEVFTTLLLLGGVGSFVYFFSNVTAFFVEGDVQRLLWRKRMRKAIEGLSDHVIVCGGGSTGQHVLRELLDTRRAFVLIENDEGRIGGLMRLLGDDLHVVIGDATEDESLVAAGIERASGLVSCLSNDKDNLIVTVSARILRPDVRIVCRCIDEKVEQKMRRSGADSVVSPNRIGGLRMISELVRPTAVSFLDRMLRDRESGLRVESIEVREGSELAGTTVGALKARGLEGLLVLALHEDGNDWRQAPGDAASLRPGVSIVYIGEPAARQSLEKLAREGS